MLDLLIKWLMLSSDAGRGCLGKAAVWLLRCDPSGRHWPGAEGSLCQSGFSWALPLLLQVS